jgi:hypothetical protein
MRHGESVRNAGAPQSSPPPSNGYGPYRILAVCHINLWPAVSMELGQDRWLKQLVAEVRGPILAGDQGSRQGHHCCETALTGNLSSEVWDTPPSATAGPCFGKQPVSPLDQWHMVKVWEMQELQNITLLLFAISDVIVIRKLQLKFTLFKTKLSSNFPSKYERSTYFAYNLISVYLM